MLFLVVFWVYTILFSFYHIIWIVFVCFLNIYYLLQFWDKHSWSLPSKFSSFVPCGSQISFQSQDITLWDCDLQIFSQCFLEQDFSFLPTHCFQFISPLKHYPSCSSRHRCSCLLNKFCPLPNRLFACNIAGLAGYWCLHYSKWLQNK